MNSTDPVVQEILGFTDFFAGELARGMIIFIIGVAVILVAIWLIVSKFKK